MNRPSVYSGGGLVMATVNSFHGRCERSGYISRCVRLQLLTERRPPKKTASLANTRQSGEGQLRRLSIQLQPRVWNSLATDIDIELVIHRFIPSLKT